MSFLTLPTKVADLKRLRAIIKLVFDAGFIYAVNQTRLTHLLSWQHRVLLFLRPDAAHADKSDPATAPARLRELLIELGPTFIKLGQMVSVRSDLLPPDYTAALATLTNRVPPVPFSQARAIIEAELKRPLDEAFSEFDLDPIGAASLAQVYRAKLPGGEVVAVKVQRPGIAPTVRQDIDLMRHLAHWIERHAPELAGFRPVELVDEFADAIGRELNFKTEASHARRFEAMFEGSKTVKIAHIYGDYSTSRVLTMDFIDGASVDDLPALAALGIHAQDLARNGALAILRQIFVAGFFHADPHPGNYLALPGNVFGFLDYGMVGRLSPRERWELTAFFQNLLRHDFDAAIRHLLRLAVTSRNSKTSAFEHDVEDILYASMGSNSQGRSHGRSQGIGLGEAFLQVIESGSRNALYFPSSLALLGKCLLTMEAMAYRLDPNFDLGALFSSLASEIVLEQLDLARLKDAAQDKAFDAVTYAEILPEAALRLLSRLSEGDFAVRIDEAQLRQFEDSFAAQGMKRLGTAFAAGLLFFAALAYAVRTKYPRFL